MSSSASRIRHAIFDLDGTLVDTRPLVVEAYRRAGVIMPDDAWGKTAEEWLPQCTRFNWRHVHDRKQQFYAELLADTNFERNEACRAMIELRYSNVQTFVLTAASVYTTREILYRLFEPYQFNLLGCGADRSRKEHQMRMLGRPQTTLWVDDDEDTCDFMEDLGCRVVCYKEGITTKEEICRASSWLPDAVND